MQQMIIHLEYPICIHLEIEYPDFFKWIQMQQWSSGKHVILSGQFSMTETVYPSFSRCFPWIVLFNLWKMSGHAEDSAKPQALLQGGVTVVTVYSPRGPRPVISRAICSGGTWSDAQERLDLTLWLCQQFAIENGPVDIVYFPIKNGGSFQFAM